jgi:hypothetical protein
LLALEGGIPPADLLRPLLELSVSRGYDALEVRHLLPEGLYQPIVSECLVTRLVLTLRCRVNAWSGMVSFEQNVNRARTVRWFLDRVELATLYARPYSLCRDTKDLRSLRDGNAAPVLSMFGR